MQCHQFDSSGSLEDVTITRKVLVVSQETSPDSPGSVFKVRNYRAAAHLAHDMEKLNPKQEGQGNLFPVATCRRSNVFTSGAGQTPSL